jgi:DNA-binding PucR family transcriptional regulator
VAAREEVAVLAAHGRDAGLTGVLRVEEYLLEIVLGRSGALVDRLRARVLGPLAGIERGELVRTLQTLLRCHLDRTAASAQLHVHRNTLSYRLRRIEELSGLDLSRPRDVAYAYVALREGRSAD